MRSSRLLVLLFALLASPAVAQDAQQARSAQRSGDYEQAIDLYRDVLQSDPGAVQMRIGLMDALASTGAYAEAIEVGLAAPDAAAVDNALGEAFLRVGRIDEAQAAFDRAARSVGPFALTAEVNLAELLFNRGQIDEAMSRFDRFIDIYNGANGRLTARELVAVGRAVRYMGRTASNMFQDALRAFDEALAIDPTWQEPRVRIGDLFLEKYDSPSAQTEYQTVLEQNPNHPGALLGMARAIWFDGSGDAEPAIQLVLEVDPNNVEARTLLARQFMTRQGFDAAREELEQALEVNPSSLSALTQLAGVHMLLDDPASFEEVRGRVLALNPRYAEMGAELADLAVRVRRYRDAVARAGEAVTLDPEYWEAWGLLGMNQLRVGEIEEGRANLERAFGGDPFNPWFKNSLDLLDTFDRFTIRRSEHFELFLHEDEADLLATYLIPIAEEAYDSLSRHYGVEPELPVRAEFYPSHADFSVRTLGEAGLGALGVSFGKVVVMDSPTARQLGDYNWASVFWHELSHTFHLALSADRVPRWFSEGLAVHEQRKARPNWGHQPTIPWVQALAQGRLKKASEMDDGLMRPDYPQQVVFTYLQASLVFQVIEERWGFDAIVEMIHGYRDGGSTESIFESVLGISLDQFDEELDDYLRERYRQPMQALAEIAEQPGGTAGIAALQDFVRRHPGDLIGRLRLGVTLLREERYEEAEEQLQAARQMFPEYGEADSPYWFLAQIHREQGELDRAAAALNRLNELSESNYEALVMQADILEELERPGEAATALNKAVLIWPYEMELHRRLAALNTVVGNHEEAVRERQAVISLRPVDRAEAFYLLATAQRDAGDATASRRSVLRALEIAPSYGGALELLLELRGGN
ncbi:MAG: tetratricopeptide repeat protein [Gemmatimonadota bacterium]|nr:tetratricopeptide repeat protein [Gemmatimonadota bacterium]